MENDCAFAYLGEKYTSILQIIKVKDMCAMYTIGIWSLHWTLFTNTCLALTRIIQSLYYAPAGCSSSDSADRGRSIIQVSLAKRYITAGLFGLA
jgi:hypothetical protein